MRNLSSFVLVQLLCVFTISVQQEEPITEDVGRGIVFPDGDYSETVDVLVTGEESAPSAAIRNPPPRYNRKTPNRQSGRYPYVDTFLQALEPFLHIDVDVSPNSFFVPDPGYNVHHHHHHNPNDVPFHPQHLAHKPPLPQHRPPKRVPPQQHPQKQQQFKFPTEKPSQQQQRPVLTQHRPQQAQRPLQTNKHPAIVFNKPPIRLHPGSFFTLYFNPIVIVAYWVTVLRMSHAS